MKKAGMVSVSIMGGDLASVHVVADAAVTQFPPTAWVLLWVDRFVGDAATEQDLGFGSYLGVRPVGVALVKEFMCHLRSGRFDGLIAHIPWLVCRGVFLYLL